MILKRAAPRPAPISLVPMIDVMLILLVFFMVTSSYLNLDMIPAVQPGGNAGASARKPQNTLMIRISSDGRAYLRGQALSAQMLETTLQDLNKSEGAQLFLLPSGAAKTQDLVAVMDLATSLGLTQVKVLRLEAME